jgi:hypothetical protein
VEFLVTHRASSQSCFGFQFQFFPFVVRQRMSLRANHYHHDSIRVRLPIKNEIKSHLDLRLCEKFDWIKLIGLSLTPYYFSLPSMKKISAIGELHG